MPNSEEKPLGPKKTESGFRRAMMKYVVAALLPAILVGLVSTQAKEALVSIRLAEGSWTGTKLLWLDPSKPSVKSEARLLVTNDRLEYEWAYEGKPQEGSLTITSDGVVFQDSWHQAEARKLSLVKESRAIVCGEYAYGSPEAPHWTWRVIVSMRPNEQLVVQMINIAPWGEEMSAVEIVSERHK